jgi:putative sterol carrier protein
MASLATDSISYTDLYTRWEHGNWSAMDLDFTEDKRQWDEEFTGFEKQAAIWNYALFFWGEDAVADNLSPYIDAAPTEEQKYFLTTQQVDEARHAVFFKRFMEEVCGIGNGTMEGGLQAIRPQLTPGFTKIFDRLDLMSDELRQATRTSKRIPTLAKAVTLYHLIVEATLAQPGQHMICSYLEERNLLPAFQEGMRNIAADEQRHIGFGVKLLADLNRQDERVPYYVASILREMLPYTSQVLMPPNWDERYLTVFGYSFDKIGGEGALSLRTKLRSAGLPVEELPGPPVMLPGLNAEEAATRGRLLAQANIVGVRQGPSKRDKETVAMLFDTLQRQAMVGTNKKTTVIQWDFTDQDISSWQMKFGNQVEAQEHEPWSPNLILKISYQDWVDIIGDRLTPQKAFLKGKIRFKGSIPALSVLSKAFA